ncbi:MAG: hypothetical protein JW818_22295 [Pirellulales bacterium]|nr:hypothetical protein [Pirellulales bacterium]
MSDMLDPYYQWLGIPPEEQPPNAYRLLGIRLGEDNTEVIRTAAERQMAHLRTFQLGEHSELSQRLLNEVASARAILLDPRKRAEVDRKLATRPGGQARPVPTVALGSVRRRRRVPWQAMLLGVGAVLVGLAMLAGFRYLSNRLEKPSEDDGLPRVVKPTPKVDLSPPEPDEPKPAPKVLESKMRTPGKEPKP